MALSHVLVIDDDVDTQANLKDVLELDDYSVETAGSISEALHRDKWAKYFAIILDRRLADGTAEELLPHLKRLAPDAAVLMVTGYADLQGAIEALRHGATDYILKPINPDALRASLARVAERRRLQLEKQSSEIAFGALVEAAPCMIVILRPDQEVLYFSRFAEELTGFSLDDALGLDYVSTFVPEEQRRQIADHIRRVFAGVPVRSLEHQLMRKDGGRRWMVWNARRLADYEGHPAVLIVGQDITSLKQAQEQALQAERLAAIGQMMTGLAHESGNALARSQSCLEMLTWEVEDQPEALELITSIQKAQDHLKQLYEEVRGYAAPIRLDRELWDVSGVWRQTWSNLALIRQGKDAALCEKIDGVELACPIDQFRLDQVFRNILENALAACPAPVRIEIAASDCLLHGRPALRLAVQDNGPGMTAEQRERIFEPFFTTKTKGTGLGMAIAKRIVEAHGGQIAVGSGSGAGAEILITLPRDSQ